MMCLNCVLWTVGANGTQHKATLIVLAGLSGNQMVRVRARVRVMVRVNTTVRVRVTIRVTAERAPQQVLGLPLAAALDELDSHLLTGRHVDRPLHEPVRAPSRATDRRFACRASGNSRVGVRVRAYGLGVRWRVKVRDRVQDFLAVLRETFDSVATTCSSEVFPLAAKFETGSHQRRRALGLGETPIWRTC